MTDSAKAMEVIDAEKIQDVPEDMSHEEQNVPAETLGGIPAERMNADGNEISKNTKKRRWRGAEPVCSEVGTAGDDGNCITPAEMHDRRKVLNHVYGPEAVASVHLQNVSVPIRFIDVNKLVLWILASGTAPSWAQVKNKPLVEKFLVVYACGIDRALWESKKGHMPNLSTFFGSPLTTVAANPTQTPLKGAGVFLSLPVPKKEQKSFQSQLVKRRKTMGKPLGPSHYVLSEQQMEKYDYPMYVLDENGDKRCPTGYIETVTSESGSESLHMVAFDCEMCETAEGQELTRMTLVNEDGKVLVDELVKPDNVITDYLTEFSGITPKMMEKVTMRLQDAQALFASHISSDTYLIGHGLENDLKAIKILHGKVLDTVVMYPHPRGFPSRSALKVLSEKFLHRKIQTGAHDSAADAQAAMDLVKLKLKHGPDFAEGDMARRLTHTVKLVETLHSDKVRCCLVDRKHVLSSNSFAATDVVPVGSDAEAEAAVIKIMQTESKKSKKFVWTQFQELGRFYFQRSKHEQGLLKLDSGTKPNFSEEKCIEIVEEMDRRIGNIFRECPDNSVIMIVTGQGNTIDAMTKQENKMKRQQGIGPRWTREDEQNWNILSQKVIQGLCFVSVKGKN